MLGRVCFCYLGLTQGQAPIADSFKRAKEQEERGNAIFNFTMVELCLHLPGRGTSSDRLHGDMDMETTFLLV
jgi:hypothetical protein